jgi:hypothetical protein
MIRKPRNLFKARRRGRMAYVGPEFVGPEPNYLPCLDELVKRHGDQLGRGELNHVAVYHDDDCSIWEGGACDCDPAVKLLDGGPSGPPCDPRRINL